MNEVNVEGNQTSTQELHDYQGTARSRAWIVAAVLFFILLIVGVVFAVIAMVSNPSQTETVRDIVIIFMAVESLLIGLVLIVLIVQLARLTALLQDEVKPILDSTNETISTLRGTTSFLSTNLVKPVVKISSSITALRRAIELLRPGGTRER
jgi:hypothetical protein